MRVDEIIGSKGISHGFNTLAGHFGRGKYARDYNILVQDAVDDFRRRNRRSFIDYLREKEVPADSIMDYHRALAGQYAAKLNRWDQRQGEVIVGKHLPGGAMFRHQDGRVEYNQS